MRTWRIAATVMVLALGWTSSATAQSTPCADHAGFDAFEFWIGSWDVFRWQDGQHVGINVIEPIESGCALLERWEGDKGSTGTSLNWYDPVADTWRQVWVSAGAYAIDLRGGLREDGMVLEGTITYYAQDRTAEFRGTWTPQADGSVRQRFEQRGEDGHWSAWFDGRYVRR